MTQIEMVIDFLKRNNGQVTAANVRYMGISTNVLSRMVNRKLLEKIAPGVYIEPFEFGDDFAALQYRFSRGIFFKSSALFLHGMIDRTPDTYEMNFPINYSPNVDLTVPLKTYRQIEKLYEIGIEQLPSPGGQLVNVYNVERTLCDIVRPQYKSDSETIKQAFQSYVNSNGMDVYRLMAYAKTFKVEPQIRAYMEVLL